ncbi:MAG: 50S ribosomal protein L5 [Planctomycetaceae bacterium]|nr:50S ribosomal protein L5 [Planctomycetaceae bacterium]
MAELPENYEARLRTLYREKIVPVLREKTGRQNLMSLPKLDKIIINMGVGSAVTDKKNIEDAQAAMTLIAGQKAMVTTARKSIANFRLREGMPIGVKVTLRGNRMYEFLDRLITFVLPRVRDFRGVSEKAFDGNGNYSLSLTEYLVFPELNPDKFTRKQGMNICFVTTARNDVEGRLLLDQFGVPFRRRKSESGKVGAGAE